MLSSVLDGGLRRERPLKRRSSFYPQSNSLERDTFSSISVTQTYYHEALLDNELTGTERKKNKGHPSCVNASTVPKRRFVFLSVFSNPGGYVSVRTPWMDLVLFNLKN